MAYSIPEIIIHAGLHKTATTSIQTTLSEPGNQTYLINNSIVYPSSWPKNHSIPLYSNFCDNPTKYHINVRQGLNMAQIKATNRGYLKNLENEIEATTPQRLILSGEDISNLSVHGLQRFQEYIYDQFQPTSIRVILFVRDPISYSISRIQQIVKGGKNLEAAFEINLENKLHSFQKKLEDLISVFSKQLVEVYAFEQATTHPHGPVGYFLSKIGFKEKEINQFQFVKSNESLSLLATRMISFINERYPLFLNGALNSPRNSNDTISIAKISGAKFDLPYEHKQMLKDIYSKEACWLKDKFDIDYTSDIINQDSMIDNRMSDLQITQIKNAYLESPPLIQTLIIEYLKEIMLAQGNISENALREFISDIEDVSRTAKNSSVFNRKAC